MMIPKRFLSLIVAGAFIGVALLTLRASPPPPPSYPVKVFFMHSSPNNDVGPQYVLQMRIWYNDVLVYNATAQYRQNFPIATSSARFPPGGTIKTELTLSQAGGVVLQTNGISTVGFRGGTGWIAGSVLTPDRKVRHTWTNEYNNVNAEALCLQFTIHENKY